MFRTITRRVLWVVLSLLPWGMVHATTPLDRSRDAVRVLNEMLQPEEDSIPRELLRNAKAVAVIPDLIKAGFIFGGRRGEGLISIKNPDGSWSAPSFITMTGGSVGFQAGLSSSDILLIFRTQRGVDSIVDGKFTLGADAAAAAGPVGRSVSAQTDSQLKAEIYTYARSRGLFAGVALDGSVMNIDYDANAKVYGKGVTPRRIFEGGVSHVPESVMAFHEHLQKYSAEK